MKSLEHMSIRELAFFVTIMSIVWIAAMLFFGVIEDADIYSIIIVLVILACHVRYSIYS